MFRGKASEIGSDRFLSITIAKKEYTVNLKAAEANPCGYGLIFQRWYWGNASRELIEIAMKNRPDGTFVLRDASSDECFTLTMKVKRQDRLIKILCKDGKCGFNYDSLDFDSVMELLDAHREHSLYDYNPDLNIPLSFPLGRVVVLGKRSSRAPVDESYKRIYMSMRCYMEGIIADYERVAGLFDHLYWRKVTVEEGITDRREKVKTFELVSWMLCKRIGYMRIRKNKVAAWVRDNFVRTMLRFHKIVRQIKHVRPSFHQDAMNFEDLLEVIDNTLEGMEPEVVSAYEAAEDWKQIIADQGVGNEGANSIAMDVGYLVALEPIQMSELLLTIELPWDPTRWISVDSNKEHAVQRINNVMKDIGDDNDGVFLIRPSASRDKCFVLTVSVNKKVHNCLIFYQPEPRPGEDEAAGFAFMDTPNYFPTLVDFVKFYSTYTLKEHNDMLDTRLRFPAFEGDDVMNYI